MRKFMKKEFVTIIGLVGWTLVALVPGRTQDIPRQRIILDPRMNPAILSYPKELPIEWGRSLEARDTTLGVLLSIDPSQSVVIVNRNASAFQFYYYDQGAQGWKAETLHPRNLKSVSCRTCERLIKISFHDAVETKQYDLKLGTFSILDMTADGKRWRLVMAE